MRYSAKDRGVLEMDRIFIQDLLLRCIIGVYPEEREEVQDVVINLSLSADLRKAGRTDDIHDTVDYKRIKKRIRQHVTGHAFNLIEKVAHDVAAICLDHEGVEAVTVRVDKPGALRFARSVAVEIERRREDQGDAAGIPPDNR